LTGLDIYELLNEIDRLKLDLKIHEKYQLTASDNEIEINKQLISLSKRRLKELYKAAIYEC
jgi:hypothetical protein